MNWFYPTIGRKVRELDMAGQVLFLGFVTGRARVPAFTWERTARQFRAHYRRLAGRPLGDIDRAILTAPPIL